MPMPPTRPLLRRHAVPFAASFAGLTVALLALYATKQLPMLSARGVPVWTIVEALLLAVPFTAAMTMPMASFIAVLWVFTRLRAEGALTTVRLARGSVRRVVTPVLAAALATAAVAFVVTGEVVPRTNGRLASVLAGKPVYPSERTMTIGELQTAARRARAEVGADAVVAAANYEIEIQKKYALPAACIVLAMAGAAIGLRFRRGGPVLVIGASGVVLSAYYACIITGESLAGRLVVSPFVAMWTANAIMLLAASVLIWAGRWPRVPGQPEPLVLSS